MELIPNNTINDVKVIKNSKFLDDRGSFSKIYFDLLENKLNFKVDEIFYSKNNKNVIRGIHFQHKEEYLGKIVHCLDGEIEDLFIDLRQNSKSFGLHSSITLSSNNGLSVYIPKGFGHGFSVLSETATVVYIQDGIYDGNLEGGINPLSLDFDWKVDQPIVSEKDLSYPSFDINNEIFKI